LEDEVMTPECKEQQEKIARSLIGDLTEAERRSLEDHLRTCAICRSEKESYAGTLDLLQSLQDEPVPRHFFIHPDEPESNPWRLYRRMKPRWQWITAAAAVLFLLVGMAAVSRFQFRSYAGGWTVDFGNDSRIAALEEQISKLSNERNRYATTAQLLEMRSGFESILADMSRQQQLLLTALELQDSKQTGQLISAEARWRKDAGELLTALYQNVTGYRAQDLENIGSRFNSLEMTQAVQARQTNAILTALMQESGSGLNKTEN
jgi:hypothetical protein